MDFAEGVGESSSAPRSFGGFSCCEIISFVYNRLLEIGNEAATGHPEFRDQLEAHFKRLPASYALNINLDRVEDVLLHQKLLILAKDPKNRPVFHVRFLENFGTQADGDDYQQELTVGPELSHDRNPEMDFEACSKLDDLNLEVGRTSLDKDKENLDGDSFRRQDDINVPIHEVIFSTVDKPKLLSQLSALLFDIGLNIREAHVFSTTDGFLLDVFVVDGWPLQETKALRVKMESAIAKSQGLKEHRDSLSLLPDELLAVVLSNFSDISEAMRTSILASRWRHLWTKLDNVEFLFPRGSEERLTHFKRTVNVLLEVPEKLGTLVILCFESLQDEEVRYWLLRASARKTSFMDLIIWQDLYIPDSFVETTTLKAFNVDLKKHNLSFSGVGFQALKILYLTNCCLSVNQDELFSFINNSPQLEELYMESCSRDKAGFQLISSNTLKRLEIESTYSDRFLCYELKVSCSKLTFLKIKGNVAKKFFFELPSLKEAVITLENDALLPNPKLRAIFSNLEYLKARLGFIRENIGLFSGALQLNLKTLILTTTSDFDWDEFTCVAQLISNIPLLKLQVYEVVAYSDDFTTRFGKRWWKYDKKVEAFYHETFTFVDIEGHIKSFTYRGNQAGKYFEIPRVCVSNDEKVVLLKAVYYWKYDQSPTKEQKERIEAAKENDGPADMEKFLGEVKPDKE